MLRVSWGYVHLECLGWPSQGELSVRTLSKIGLAMYTYFIMTYSFQKTGLNLGEGVTIPQVIFPAKHLDGL